MAMKTIAVFGASGQTGSLIFRSAIARGMAVKAHCRDSSLIVEQYENLQVIEGSFENLPSIKEAIAETQAVIAVYGPRPRRADIFCAKATANILSVMGELGVRRFICVTGALVGQSSANRGFFYRQMRRSIEKRTPELIRDRDEQEKVIEDSSLDWTIVKPPRLSNAQAKGRFKAGVNLQVGILSSIGRADLANFILDQLDSTQFLHRKVFIRY